MGHSSVGAVCAAEAGAPVCAHIVELRKPRPMSAYDRPRLVVVRGGTGTAEMANGPPIGLRPGTVALVLSGVPLAVHPDGRLWVSRLFMAEDYLLWQVGAWCGQTGFDKTSAQLILAAMFPSSARQGIVTGEPADRLGARLDDLVSLTKLSRLGVQHWDAQEMMMVVLGLVMPVLADPGSVARPGGGGRLVSPAVVKANRWIKDHAAQEWRVGDVAAAVGMSGSGLGKALVGAYGKSALQLRDMYRIQIQAQALAAGVPARKAATVAGWDKPERAGAKFEEATGLTPAAWQARHVGVATQTASRPVSPADMALAAR